MRLYVCLISPWRPEKAIDSNKRYRLLVQWKDINNYELTVYGASKWVCVMNHDRHTGSKCTWNDIENVVMLVACGINCAWWFLLWNPVHGCFFNIGLLFCPRWILIIPEKGPQNKIKLYILDFLKHLLIKEWNNHIYCVKMGFHLLQQKVKKNL